MVVDLWVRDNCTGDVHQIGTNRHDSIELFEDDHGRLTAEYVNMQNGSGTFRGGYSFIPRPDIDTGYMCLTPEEMYLNEAYIDERLYNFLKKYKPKYDDPEEKAKYNKRIIKTIVKIQRKIQRKLKRFDKQKTK